MAAQVLGKPLAQYEKDYKEKKSLGSGAQGAVVLVKSKRGLGKVFAAKKQIKVDNSDFQSMKREQEMLMKMNHRNIVRLEDSYEDTK